MARIRSNIQLYIIGTMILLAGLFSCHRKHVFDVDQMMDSKIKFDVQQLDKDGLTGPEDGKRSISYEFCIPDTRIYREKVKKIDPTLIFTKSMGRSMCDRTQVLCMGNTHQPNAVKVLRKLSSLSYVEKITETYFE